MNSSPAAPSHALGRAARLAGLSAGWLLLYLAGPGIVTPAGLGVLAPLGIALWALCASRPGPRAFWIETLVAGVAWSGVCSWAALVHWSSLLFIGPGFGLYYAGAGALLRRLARKLPLALAAPAAWLFVETVRSVLEPPFGLSWMRLGVHWHDVAWLNGSARVFGVWGLSYAAAAIGGSLADLLMTWRSDKPEARARRRWSVAAGGGAMLVLAATSAWTKPPAFENGPRVLLVQPAFAQERKMKRDRTGPELFRESRDLTLKGLEAASRAGKRPPDLVAWGESMFPQYVVDPGLREALRQGAHSRPWFNDGLDLEAADVDLIERFEDNWVREALLQSSKSKSGILPLGTVFLSGVELLMARDGWVGRQNAVTLWNADGTRGAHVGKRHLVPGAETMLGLERFELVRSTIFDLAGYVPDLLPHEGSRRLQFRDRAGREFVLGITVCFDNSYDGPFVTPLLEGPVDFHLVCSNEAWFKRGQEPDQMMAFSRLEAIATARSIVRATNSGISAVFDPAGNEVDRLVVDGQDREVAGTLLADVPVPVAEQRGSTSIYVRSWRLWPALALVWPWILLLLTRRRPGYSAGSAG